MLNRDLAEDDALADIFYEEPIVDDDDDDIVSLLLFSQHHVCMHIQL